MKLENISLSKSFSSNFAKQLKDRHFEASGSKSFKFSAKFSAKCVLLTLLLFSTAFIKGTNVRSIIETKQQV